MNKDIASIYNLYVESKDDAVERIDDRGNRRWTKDNLLHREDGPAIILANGTEEWYKNGKRHREDGPAIKYRNGNEYWILNGVRHRDDGPAIDEHDRKEWYQHGKLHRDDGPAVIRTGPGDTKVAIWYKHNVGHRLDGPAFITGDADDPEVAHWYVDGTKYDDMNQWAKAALEYQGKSSDKASVAAYLRPFLPLMASKVASEI